MHPQPDQSRARTERPCEQQKAVQQRPGIESAGAQSERAIDRVLADVDVRAVGSSAQQLEQSIGSPQGGRERVAHAPTSATRDRVQLRQAEGDARRVGEMNSRDRGLRDARGDALAQHPGHCGIGQ